MAKSVIGGLINLGSKVAIKESQKTNYSTNTSYDSGEWLALGIVTIICLATIVIIVGGYYYLKSYFRRKISKIIQERIIEDLRQLIPWLLLVNISDSAGRTLLMQACSIGRTEVAELLINNGVNINASIVGEKGLMYNALIFSLVGGFTECAELLIKRGAYIKLGRGNSHDKNLDSNEGQFVLQNTNDECKRLLEKYGYYSHTEALRKSINNHTLYH